jgi:hypothetical protein
VGGINRSRERHKSCGLEVASQRWQPGERFALKKRTYSLLGQRKPTRGFAWLMRLPVNRLGPEVSETHSNGVEIAVAHGWIERIALSNALYGSPVMEGSCQFLGLDSGSSQPLGGDERSTDCLGEMATKLPKRCSEQMVR